MWTVSPEWLAARKVGVSNVLVELFKIHEANGVFGSLVLSVYCDDGGVPARLERDLKVFIAEHTDVRAPRVDGFTESFPAWLLGEVLGEVLRLVGEVGVPVTLSVLWWPVVVFVAGVRVFLLWGGVIVFAWVVVGVFQQ